MDSSLRSQSFSDLENGRTAEKGANVTFISVDSEKPPPIFGRRLTSRSGDADSLRQKLEIDKDEDTLNKVGNMLTKIQNSSVVFRYTLYILPVAALLAIPMAIFCVEPYKKTKSGQFFLLSIFIWVEVLWASLWICKIIAHFLPALFHATCGLVSGGVRKYSQVLTSLEVPVSLFLWSIVAYATTSVTCVIDYNQDGNVDARKLCRNIPAKPDGQPPNPPYDTLQTAFKAGIIVAAIFLAEKSFIQIVSINYHRKQYDEKIRQSKRLIRILDHLYDASRALFPEFCREFEDEDADIQSNTLADVRTTLARRGVQTKLLNNLGRVRDKAAAAFGAMASDIAGKQVFSTTSAHSIVIEALENERSSKALARRLWMSFVRRDQDALSKQDLIDVLGSQHADEAEEIFVHLDRDGNGDVSLDEMTMLVVSAGEERKNRATSMRDISQAIAVLDRLLSLFVLLGQYCGICFLVLKLT